MFSSACLAITVTFLVTFICVVHLMEVPNKSDSNLEGHNNQHRSEATSTLEDRITALEKEMRKAQEDFKASSVGSHDSTSRHQEKRDADDSHSNLFYDNPQYAGSACSINDFLRLHGTPGPVGPQGLPGMQGIPGRDGREPPSGNCCSTAEPPSVAAQSGSVYVRWGRIDCPQVSDFIYNGIAAGSKHRDLPGGGSNILCMPNNPIFDDPVAGVGSGRAFIYSVAYQIENFPRLEGLHYADVPCVVCKATHRYAKFMVPGRNVCPSSEWTLEYGGYLMAERSHPVHHKSMFICVDKNMQGASNRGTGVGPSADRGSLDLVEGECSTNGGLPCDTFTAGYEFTCAVCTM